MRRKSLFEPPAPEDQRIARRMIIKLFAADASLALVVVAGLAIRATVLDRQPGDGRPHQTWAADDGSFAATEAPSDQACARRDVRVVTAIEAHGDARDVSGAKLAEALFAVQRARSACATGAVDAALAIYDGIRFSPGPSTD